MAAGIEKFQAKELRELTRQKEGNRAVFVSTRADAGSSPLSASHSSEISSATIDGIVAGAIGASVIALWFLILDSLTGRPFYTPSVLGTALFRRGVPLEPETLIISFEMTLMYTWLHGLIFCILGGLASRLLALAEQNLNLGFGIVLFFVVFEFGFVAAAFLFAEPVLRALAWPAILIGNLLAAGAMALYLWRRHPKLIIRP
ncbi:MAG TPA: hypothetical protein VNL14_21480 [Candidatus Acidoferrales bacterium]|nr:hypothetical protein [Candidatus Acidoferrales bacterium]